MTDPQRRLDEMIGKLKERNFRLTPQRLAVLKILASSLGHPSVDMIYTQVIRDFPTTSLATVYKTVTLLKELGEVLELGFGDGSNRYDGNKPFPHPHLVCIRCRKIIDPPVDALTEMADEMARQTGYQIVSHRLDFFGICPKCQKKKLPAGS